MDVPLFRFRDHVGGCRSAVRGNFGCNPGRNFVGMTPTIRESIHIHRVDTEIKLFFHSPTIRPRSDYYFLPGILYPIQKRGGVFRFFKDFSRLLFLVLANFLH
jgi:hypothetical protein